MPRFRSELPAGIAISHAFQESAVKLRQTASQLLLDFRSGASIAGDAV